MLIDAYLFSLVSTFLFSLTFIFSSSVSFTVSSFSCVRVCSFLHSSVLVFTIPTFHEWSISFTPKGLIAIYIFISSDSWSPNGCCTDIPISVCQRLQFVHLTLIPVSSILIVRDLKLSFQASFTIKVGHLKSSTNVAYLGVSWFHFSSLLLSPA